MLSLPSNVMAHEGGVGPHEALWTHWNGDPTLLGTLGVLAWAFHRGAARRRRPRPRDRWFWVGLVALAVALASPLDVVAAELASAHMVQHVLLVAVAAPLLSWSAPVATLLRGAPSALGGGLRGIRRAARRRTRSRTLSRPGALWLLHAATLWFWHASVPYGAALDVEAVHAAEHASLLLTAVLFWTSALRPAPAAVSDGYRVLLVFTMAMQGVLLSLLLTFATSPWYDGYLRSTAAWGLDPLADQQLAGAIMWVPAGFAYLVAALALVTRWVRATDTRTGAHDDWPGGAGGVGQPSAATSSTTPAR